MYFFRLQNHPRKIEFNQCVTFDTFEQTWLEKLYAISNVSVLYGLPLLVILICYIQICIKSFSRKHCRPGKRASALGASTNEPLGASSIIVPIREGEEDDDEDEAPEEEEEEEEDREEDEKKINCSGGSDNKRSKENTRSFKDESLNEVKEAVGTTNDVKVTVTLSNQMRVAAAGSSEGEKVESGKQEQKKRKDEVASSSSSSVNRGEKSEHPHHETRQCILMKSLSDEKSVNNHSKSVQVSATVSSSAVVSIMKDKLVHTEHISN